MPGDVITEEFNAGDVVWLKSGGPRMTIRAILDNEANVSWFKGGKERKGRFPLVTLTKTEPEGCGSLLENMKKT